MSQREEIRQMEVAELLNQAMQGLDAGLSRLHEALGVSALADDDGDFIVIRKAAVQIDAVSELLLDLMMPEGEGEVEIEGAEEILP